ncbi:MAG: YeeE/YedE family protein [Proteobacteria bacterium]|nr:YeeE/YedE family protein [Pseudomonadota bacterium]
MTSAKTYPERRNLLTGLAVAAILLGIAYLSSFMLEDRSLTLSLGLGLVTGFVFQRGRFCFYCNLADYLDKRETAGLLSIIIALASGAVLYVLIFSAWLPNPAWPNLPPTAHIGPVGPTLFLAAVVFGAGMALSRSCLSAHFYRLGEGAFSSLFAITGAGLGFIAGFRTWNGLYTWSVFDDPPLWLPHLAGYVPALALTGAALLALAFFIQRNARKTEASTRPAPSGLAALFTGRWPAAVTGILVGVISAASYLRIAPLGVTAEVGSLARMTGQSLGIVTDTLQGLDTLRGCISALRDTVFSRNGLFVLGLIGGSFSAALASGQFQPQRPTLRKALLNLSGGILLGWGAMTALGCTIGVLLSGIQAGAVSGWIFLAGSIAGVLILRRVQALFTILRP